MAIATTAFVVLPQPKSLPWIECLASPPLVGVKQQEVKAGVSTPEKFRSEEHTSELQSQSNLVCRLLLEKKKCCPRAVRLPRAGSAVPARSRRSEIDTRPAPQRARAPPPSDCAPSWRRREKRWSALPPFA